MKKSIITAVALTAAVALGGCAPVGESVETVAPEEIVDEATETQTGGDILVGDASEDLPDAQPQVDTEEPEEQTDEEEQGVAVTVRNVKYIKVTGSGVNIRSGAGTSYASLGAAEQNTLYAYLGQSGGWYKTLYKNQTVYISAKYCEEVELERSQSGDVEKVIGEGLNLLGVKYVYGAVRYHDGTGKLNGGFTDTEFDCSSLTQYVYFKGAGVLLQVNTRTQIYQGEHVENEDLQRGDLMFFTNDSRYNNTGIERVGHVAIYLGGNYILHTSSDYAKIEQLSAKRWSYFLEARRMI